MDAIETIIEKINQKAQLKRQEEKSDRISSINQNFTIQKEQVKNQQELQFQRQKDYLDKSFQQQQNRLKMQVRQLRLSKKQDYLEQLFQAAEENISQWGAQKHRKFFVYILKQNNLQEGTVIPGGLMAEEVYSKSWLQEINQEEGFQLIRGTASQDQEIGFLLDLKEIRYNFYYGALLQEIKKQYGGKIMQELFKNY